MLVDHFLNFKGCNPEDHVQNYDSTDLSMSEFVDERIKIFNEIPEITEPDFAQEHRLPKNARIFSESNFEDEWEKHLKDSLNHMTDEEWNKH
jgi:hypothetical protein